MSVATFNIHEAKTHFSKLVDLVCQGEEVTIARSGRPVVKLVPILSPNESRRPGSAQGSVTVSDDFNAPLPEELLSRFES